MPYTPLDEFSQKKNFDTHIAHIKTIRQILVNREPKQIVKEKKFFINSFMSNSD